MTQGVLSREVIRFEGNTRRVQADQVAAEEPLEIRLNGRTVAITMRTPGQDRDLALGFLFTEDIVTGPVEIAGIALGDNVAAIDLHPGVPVDFGRLTRHVYTTSSCGVCGKASIDAVFSACPSLPHGQPLVDAATLCRLPERLRSSQALFGQTGGLHAAALFDPDGALGAVREDVGRHNALDKLVGAAFQSGRLPLSDKVLLVSGRASFELVQKAAMAGIPLLAAVGAPSSLAVETATRVGMTLIGFLRGERFNIYAGAERIAAGDSS